MKIAVVGAGIFGVTIALKLSKQHDVHLFDRTSDILTCASRTNQFRLHRGFHYPRSPETVRALLDSIAFFEDEYRDAIITEFEHLYAIADVGSYVTPEQYIKFCVAHGLRFEQIERHDEIKNVSLLIRANENVLDYAALYDMCRERIQGSGVDLRLNVDFTCDDIHRYDHVINCTYSNMNALIEEDQRSDYQFEVCEKIIVQMPDHLKDLSLVVMDGPFMCIDPYGRSGRSLLGNVVHAIHSTNVGQFPNVPDVIVPMLDKGPIIDPVVTNFDRFIAAGSRFLPSLRDAEHIASLFTVRAVLPNLDATDARPTLVMPAGKKITNVFSGKIDTCVIAARSILKKLAS